MTKNSSTNKQLPFFVYGTLIPSQPNDHLIREALVQQEAAVFRHGRLYAFPTFPMLIETNAEDGTVIDGRLLTIDHEQYDDVMQKLDELEQYDPQDRAGSPYWREIRSVQTAANETVEAWIYLGQPAFVPPNAYLITSGSWLQHCTQSGQTDSMRRWWESYGVDLLFGKSTQSD